MFVFMKKIKKKKKSITMVAFFFPSTLNDSISLIYEYELLRST